MEITSRIPSPDWLYGASFGSVPGARVVQVQGINPDIDTVSVPEAITPFGGLFPWQSTAVAMEAVSDSASDAAAGIGGRTMVVQGLDNAHAEISEIVTLNGLTPVPLVNQYRRINNVLLLTAGSNDTNVGNIVIRTTVGAIPQAQMPPGFGRDQCCRYTVPAGYNAWVIEGYAVMLAAVSGVQDQIAFQLYAREVGAPWLSRFYLTASSATPTVVAKPSLLRSVGPGGDIVVRATAASANDFTVSATLSIVLTRV